MKLLFMNYTQGKVNRGAETFIRELSKRLQQMHSVTVVSAGQALPERWPILWRLFLDPPGLAILWFTLKHLPLIWREKYDVVLPQNGGWQALLVRFITSLYGGKMVVAGQSGKGWDDRVNVWCFPDAFVALSSSLRQWAKRINPWVRIAYIPNGVDLAVFTPQGPVAHFALERPLVLCVAALTSEKRIGLSIEAVTKMNRGSLLVVGEGLQREVLLQKGRKLLGERFAMTSASPQDLPPIYRAADVFTVPSPSYRAFEIVLVEAMACNVPVVANNDEVRQEIVGEAGLLVDPTNIDDYAKALEEALNRDWVDLPRRQAEKFSWDTIAAKYQHLLTEL